MKTKTWLTTLVIGAICQFAPQASHAQDIDSFAPVVVKDRSRSRHQERFARRNGNSRHLQQGNDGSIMELVFRLEGFGPRIGRKAALRSRPQNVRVEGETGAQQNLRLLDQQSALSWVPRHARTPSIALFAGVSDQVQLARDYPETAPNVGRLAFFAPAVNLAG